ncbi:MAG: exopolyphosphatase [Gammaproteobacteria bacterium]|nr:exopolyphosphatase [Gammaproteobacteria bacterium]
MPPPFEYIAAVDLGSNSFHMIIARLEGEQLNVVDRLREQVQLGAGLDRYKRLVPAAQNRALDCLGRFGERLRDLPHGSVRAVGTNTLRMARNSDAFLVEAERVLGHPIEIIAGREEARLIYLGVAGSIADDRGQRLVIDIGGGSTEYIIGMRSEPFYRESLFMGCVSHAKRFFAKGRITRNAIQKAELAAQQELQTIATFYRQVGWTSAIGASGTILAIAKVLQANGWSDGAITRDGLDRLREALLARGHVDKLDIDGLRRDRAPIFPSGFAILSASFDTLRIERMQVADGALREGLLYELLGRIQHHDVREKSVAALIERSRIDTTHAERVAITAAWLFDRAAEGWALDDDDRHLLLWAARLHEIGLSVAHNQFHRHGAYILTHADLAGFSRQDQQVLAALVRGHRRKFPNFEFRKLPGDRVEPARRLAVLLRLAALLNRGRSTQPLPEIGLTQAGDVVQLRFPEGWLEAHPLTRADLDEERRYLKRAGFTLVSA